MSATKPKVPTRWRYRRHVDPAGSPVERVIVAEVDGHDTPVVIARIENPMRGHPEPCGGTLWRNDWDADEAGRLMTAGPLLKVLLVDLADAAEDMLEMYGPDPDPPDEVVALREVLVRLAAHKVRRMPK